MRDRRQLPRATPDRRGARRKEMPSWAYALAFLVAGALLTGFWSLVY